MEKRSKKLTVSKAEKKEEEKEIARVLRKKVVKVRKLVKQKKLLDRVRIKGEDYKIETWAQC